MPKLKTKSGSKKRFKRTSNGLIKKKHSCKNHLLTKKSKKRKRQLRKFSILKHSDFKKVNKQF
ncbi:50S ribosomal protein L35 [Blattabacterium cuenoti]|uniref:50S ribosomal protein L35 n=1 Tax=Blattabacterium cuenoti TaxID=1653831 RepID=UPI00163C02F5|nr:50S ribosomal protein L35 [Blattabacterium cuenoti]